MGRPRFACYVRRVAPPPPRLPSRRTVPLAARLPCPLALAAALLLGALPPGTAGAQQASGAAHAGDAPAAGGAVRTAVAVDGRLVGLVRDHESGAPVPDVEVELVGGTARARSDAEGRFTLVGLAPGRHVIRFRRLGYRPGVALADVAATATPARERPTEPGGPAEPGLVVELERAATPLDRVVVSPGHYGVLRQDAAAVQTLSREALAAAPQLGEDVFRVVGRLPGVAASDFSAAFRVRGGANDEMLILLDGLPLYEPFHLKDFDGALSIVDVAAVGGLDLATGGFGAQYGDRLTGVLDMRTVAPEPGAPRSELALTLTSLRATSQGTFADERGSWLVSARRGFLEYALRMAGEGEQLDPRYHDLLGKLSYRLAPAHTVSLHLLRARDRLSYDPLPNEPRLESMYASEYLWGTWQARWHDRLSSRTVLSASRLAWERVGDRVPLFSRAADLEVIDRRDFSAVGLRQEVTAELSPRAILSGGVELRRAHAHYDYWRRRRVFTVSGDRLGVRTTRTELAPAPAGSDAGAWLTQRVRPWDALTAELGVRVDQQARHDAADGRRRGFRHETQVSPRVGVAWTPAGGTTVRAGWGRYWQAQGLHELPVQDGEGTFARAELAEQRTLGVERAFGETIAARAELYDRRHAHVRPRWESADGAVDFFPEVGPDRQRLTPAAGRSRGMELQVRRTVPAGLSWTASYALASARDQVDGRWMPRPLDQRHTVTLDVGWRPSPDWSVGMAWLYHSGWPTTSFQVTADTLANGTVLVRHVYGERNADRLAPYHRLDARIARRFHMADGRLSLFLDVFNVYDRRNPRAQQLLGGYATSEGANGSLQFDLLLPRVPSFGMAWQF